MWWGASNTLHERRLNCAEGISVLGVVFIEGIDGLPTMGDCVLTVLCSI
jgi:hypothetical protein